MITMDIVNNKKIFKTINNNMSSELHKYIETSIEKKTSLLNGEVINFPEDKKNIFLNYSKENSSDYWKIDDKSNDDQFKAVMGICFMFGTLLVIGLYANLV